MPITLYPPFKHIFPYLDKESCNNIAFICNMYILLGTLEYVDYRIYIVYNHNESPNNGLLVIVTLQYITYFEFIIAGSTIIEYLKNGH